MLISGNLGKKKEPKTIEKSEEPKEALGALVMRPVFALLSLIVRAPKLPPSPRMHRPRCKTRLRVPTTRRARKRW